MKPEAPLLWWAGVCVKPEAPLPSENAAKTAHGHRQGWSGFHPGACMAQQGWSGFHVGAGALQPGWFGFHGDACMKPEPPLSSENAPKTAYGLQRGWSGFHVGVGTPQQGRSRFHVGAGALQRGWSGFHPGACMAQRGWSGFHVGFTNHAIRPSQPRPPSESTAPRSLTAPPGSGMPPGRSGLRPVQACRPVAQGSARFRPAARWAESPPTGRWAGRAGPRSPAPARCHSRAGRPRRPETRR